PVTHQLGVKLGNGVESKTGKALALLENIVVALFTIDKLQIAKSLLPVPAVVVHVRFVLFLHVHDDLFLRLKALRNIVLFYGLRLNQVGLLKILFLFWCQSPIQLFELFKAQAGMYASGLYWSLSGSPAALVVDVMIRRPVILSKILVRPQ